MATKAKKKSTPLYGKGGSVPSGKLKELQDELADYELLVGDASVPQDEKDFAQGEIPRLKKEIDELKTGAANKAMSKIISGDFKKPSNGKGATKQTKTPAAKPGKPAPEKAAKKSPSPAKPAGKSKAEQPVEKKANYKCDDLIKEARERAARRRERAAGPKKTEATKNVEKIERVETNIEKRITKGDVTKAELEKLIKETDELLNILKAALKKM